MKLRHILVDLDQTAITHRGWAHLLASLERREEFAPRPGPIVAFAVDVPGARWRP